jgi:hypothetical protein
MWLTQETKPQQIPAPPDAFALDVERGTQPPDETPDVVAEWLKRAHGLEEVAVDGWTVFHGRGYGLTLVWDAESYPNALGYLRAMAIVNSKLAKRTDGGDAGVVSRHEMIEILKGWENPHEVADRINHARILDGVTAPRADDGGTSGGVVPSGQSPAGAAGRPRVAAPRVADGNG